MLLLRSNGRASNVASATARSGSALDRLMMALLTERRLVSGGAGYKDAAPPEHSLTLILEMPPTLSCSGDPDAHLTSSTSKLQLHFQTSYSFRCHHHSTGHKENHLGKHRLRPSCLYNHLAPDMLAIQGTDLHNKRVHPRRLKSSRQSPSRSDSGVLLTTLVHL